MRFYEQGNGGTAQLRDAGRVTITAVDLVILDDFAYDLVVEQAYLLLWSPGVCDMEEGAVFQDLMRARLFNVYYLETLRDRPRC